MKKAAILVLAFLFMAGCSADVVSEGVDSLDAASSEAVTSALKESSVANASAISTETSSVVLSVEEAYIKAQEAEYGARYTPKYEAKFGPYTPEKEAEIEKRVPIEYTLNEVSGYFHEKYIKLTDNRGLANPGWPEIDDWLHIYDRYLVNAVGFGPDFGLDLTIIGKANIDMKEVDNTTTLFKARVNKAYDTDIKIGDEILIRQQGTDKYGVQTINGVPHLQFINGQRITALLYDPKQEETIDGQTVEVYSTFCTMVLYHETIDNVDYVLDTMDQNVVEAAHFFQKAHSAKDAYKYCKDKGIDTGRELYIGILKADVLDEVLKELL